MGSPLSRRVKALEPHRDILAEMAHMTEAELAAELVRCNRVTLDDPDATDREREHARRTLALPWDQPMDGWAEAQKAEWNALYAELRPQLEELEDWERRARGKGSRFP